MAWTDITRREHNRDDLRYPSDLREAGWALIAPLRPPARTGGRPRTRDLREVMNAILYGTSAATLTPWPNVAAQGIVDAVEAVTQSQTPCL